TLETNKADLGEQKKSYQELKLYEQKLLEEQQTYKPYTKGNIFIQPTESATIPAGVSKTPATENINAPVVAPEGQTTFYKDGKTATVNTSQKQYYLNTGWSLTPPSPTVSTQQTPKDTTQTSAPASAPTVTPIQTSTPTSTPISSVPSGGIVPSWNPNSRLVWSTSGNQKEIPASEYDKYIAAGWKASK
ncbi:MAG: hypothetical protein V1788_00780, partial [Nanoarchaeota archaeon]